MSLFGNTGTSLFGNTQQTSQPTSLFGNTQQQTIQPTTSLFGNTQQPQQSTSLFGSSGSQNSSLGSASSLGSLGSQNSSLGSTSSLGSLGTTSSLGSLGNNNNASTTSSLFGQPQSTQTSSLFGQPQPQTTSLFGQPQTQTSSLFGQSQVQPQTQQSQFQLQPQQQQLQQKSFIEQKLYDFMQSISPDSVNCRYLYWFYNYNGQQVDPNTLPKPPNVTVDQWAYALSNNPNPSSLIPVPAKSFNDLKQRRESQQNIIKQLDENTQKILKDMRELENHLNFHIHSQLEMMRKKQIELIQRFIEVWSCLEIYQSKGKPFASSEERLMKRIYEIYEELNQPNSIKSKVDEISNQLKLGSMEKEKIKYEITPEAIEPLYNLLKNMTIAIERITNELEIAQKDSQILKNELLQLNKK